MWPAISPKVGMPRWMVAARRAIWSSWASLASAPARLTRRPSTSPCHPSRSSTSANSGEMTKSLSSSHNVFYSLATPGTCRRELEPGLAAGPAGELVARCQLWPPCDRRLQISQLSYRIFSYLSDLVGQGSGRDRTSRPSALAPGSARITGRSLGPGRERRGAASGGASAGRHRSRSPRPYPRDRGRRARARPTRRRRRVQRR